VNINTDAVGTTLESRVNKLLELKQYPTCFGSMVLPLTRKIKHFNPRSILAPKGAISENDIGMDNIINLFVKSEDRDLYGKFILTKTGVKSVSDYKDSVASAYVAQVDKCINCKMTELCSKLTENTLKKMELDLLFQLIEKLK
jgi:hypothetical protein